jgi:hypothetical protein
MIGTKGKCDLCKNIVESTKIKLIYNEIRKDKMVKVINYCLEYYACIDCITDITNFIKSLKKQSVFIVDSKDLTSETLLPKDYQKKGKNYESKT